MKKLISLFLIMVGSFSLFAMDIAIGATLGSEISQSYNLYDGTADSYPYSTLVGCPDFGIIADLGFDKAGIQTDLDVSFSTYKSNHYNTETKKYDYVYESTDSTVNIYVKPYYLFGKKDFKFSIGPVAGFSFYNSTTEKSDYADPDPYRKDSSIHFIWGGEFAFQYNLSRHIGAYASLPFLVKAGKLKGSSEFMGEEFKTTKYIYFGVSEEIYSIPKIGIMYQF